MDDRLLQFATEATRMLRQYIAVSSADTDVDEFGRDAVVMEAVRPFFDFLYTDYWRVAARGVRHVPSRGRALIVANHSGALPYDGSMIHMAIYKEHPRHRMPRALVENLVQYLPCIGTFVNRLGGVRGCPENAERLLHNGELVIVFPEGIKGIGKPYQDRYRLERFGRGGVVRIALKTRTPVIPCAVIGAEEIHPILWRAQPLAKWLGLPFIPITPTFPWLGPVGLIPFPSRWLLRFGPTIRYDRMDPALADDALQVHELTEALRTQIQTMVDQGLEERERLKY